MFSRSVSRLIRAMARATTMVACIALVSGSTCDTKIETVELSPLALGTLTKLDGGVSFNIFNCSGSDCGLFESPGLLTGAAKVGYFRENLCGCWLSSAKRGLVSFDVSLLSASADEITGATLEYDSKTILIEPGIAQTCCWDDMVASIWVVQEPWAGSYGDESFEIAAEWWTDTIAFENSSTVHKSVGVTEIVKDWLSGAQPNLGILFVGRDESLPANQSREQMTTLNNFKLKVLIAVPNEP